MGKRPCPRFAYLVRPAFRGPIAPARSFRGLAEALRIACRAAEPARLPFVVYVRRRGYPLLMVALVEPGRGILA